MQSYGSNQIGGARRARNDAKTRRAGLNSTKARTQWPAHERRTAG